MIAALRAAVDVEELRDRAAIGALAAEWERLRDEVKGRGGAAGPFCTPAFIGVFAASLCGRGSGRRLRLLVAHRGGRLCGVLPLLEERRRLSGAPARIVRSLSDEHSSRFDALADGEETARALFAHLARDRSWDALELRDAPPGAAVERIAEAAREAGFPTAEWPSLDSPFLPLAKDPLEAATAKFRSNLRRRARKLAGEVGAIALERIDPGADRAALDRALDDGFRLEAAGWKGEAGTAIACDPALTARYRALAHAFAARGQLALSFLTVGGERRAFHFAILDDGVYYLFKPGNDPALAAYGLGHLHLEAIARELAGSGARELDFLGDDMPWKREWTARRRLHRWHYVFQRGAYGRALAAWKVRVAPALGRLARRVRPATARR